MSYYGDKNLNVPPELLPDLSDKDKYLLYSISNLNQRFNDVDHRFDKVVEKNDKQTVILNQILEQSKITNGRVTKSEQEIESLNVDLKILQPEINSIKTYNKIIRSKIFWIAVSIVFLILVPMLTTQFPPQELLLKLLGM